MEVAVGRPVQHPERSFAKRDPATGSRPVQPEEHEALSTPVSPRPEQEHRLSGPGPAVDEGRGAERVPVGGRVPGGGDVRDRSGRGVGRHPPHHVVLGVPAEPGPEDDRLRTERERRRLDGLPHEGLRPSTPPAGGRRGIGGAVAAVRRLRGAGDEQERGRQGACQVSRPPLVASLPSPTPATGTSSTPPVDARLAAPTGARPGATRADRSPSRCNAASGASPRRDERTFRIVGRRARRPPRGSVRLHRRGLRSGHVASVRAAPAHRTERRG